MKKHLQIKRWAKKTARTLTERKKKRIDFDYSEKFIHKKIQLQMTNGWRIVITKMKILIKNVWLYWKRTKKVHLNIFASVDQREGNQQTSLFHWQFYSQQIGVIKKEHTITIRIRKNDFFDNIDLIPQNEKYYWPFWEAVVLKNNNQPNVPYVEAEIICLLQQIPGQ
jgi:hypothetical protein